MYIRVTSTKNSPRQSVKVVESRREGYQVKQHMVLHVGIASNEREIEKLRQIGEAFIAEEQRRRERESAQTSFLDPQTVEERLEAIKKQVALKKRGRKPLVTLKKVTSDDQVSLADLVEDQRVIEGIHDIAGHVYKTIGYESLGLSKKETDLLKDLVLMRLANPTSKLKTRELLDKQFLKSHRIDSIYRVMDKLTPKIDHMKEITFSSTKKLMPESVDIIFFDCTTLYFESVNTDGLREFGYSKDHRFNTTQVVLALATNADGLPIGYELFEGNKAEVKTLMDCLASWKKIFTIDSICLVADRAMMSDDNLKRLEKENCQYIVAAKLRKLPDQFISEIFSEKNYQSQIVNDALAWVGEFDYNDRRLVVSYKTDRARRDAYQRNQVIDKIKKRIGEKGKTQTFISNQGVKKYTRSDASMTVLDSDKINREAAWDGMHGVITNIRDEHVSVILSRYARLWKIEASFRIHKHTLSMRPIYHFKPERVKAHIALCFMAFSVLRHMEYHIKLTQKMSLDVMMDELMHVQASYYRHNPTGNVYRMPGKFSQTASKIYKSFRVERHNHAEVII